MTVSGLSTATLQTLLQQLNSGSSQSGSSTTNSLLSALNPSNASTSTSTSTPSQSPAYVLSDSQKKTQTQLFSYSNLGTLINKTTGSLNGLIAQTASTGAVDGLGRPLTSSVQLDVKSLAAAQTLTSGSYPSDTTDVLGTGSLSLTVGSNSPVSISITDGSLNGVAKAINDAAAGITATVVPNSDGSFKLQITGDNTGAANSFSLSGVSDLVYDASTGSGSLQATTTAADASYTVGSGTPQTSPTNTNVQVAPGVTTTFSQTGLQSITSPIGQSTADTQAQTLVSDINALIAADPNAGQSSSSSSSSKTTTLTQVLDQISQQQFGADGTSKSLSDLGITVGSNGTLSIDQTTLNSAYASNPSAFNSVISQASKAIETTLNGNDGIADQAKASVSTLLTQLVHVPSLAAILSGNSSSGSGSSSSNAEASQLLSGFTA